MALAHEGIPAIGVSSPLVRMNITRKKNIINAPCCMVSE